MLSDAGLFQLYWQEKKTLKEIGRQHGVSATAVWKRMRRLRLNRRSMSEALVNRHNPVPPFCIVEGFPKQQSLWWVGTALYWCEGTHRDKVGKEPNTATFTNANERALKIWLKFLLKGCGVRQKKLRVRLYLHPDQDELALKRYWSKVLGVPLSQFEHTTWTKKKPSKRNHANYRGTVKIKVHSKALVQQLRSWLDELQHLLLGEVAESG